ncbi:pumilio homolog 12-like [Actinidia eriantha]|uniref:pumilio homolog 12-like n=1 Tax=Actinidia eriantha TaxID=165200 RepID=UPI00258C71B6|nr:pumilio homolog 12-like [Actinidia eriantha]
MAQNCYKISTCQSEYSVLQTCVERSRGEYRDHLVAAFHLAEDLYGFVSMNLTNGPFPVPLQFEGRYFSLSFNKYTSNVVEKCLMEAGEEQASWIIIELLTSPDVHKLLVDPFGNYVIKKALKVSKASRGRERQMGLSRGRTTGRRREAQGLVEVKAGGGADESFPMRGKHLDRDSGEEPLADAEAEVGLVESKAGAKTNGLKKGKNHWQTQRSRQGW